MKPVEITSIDFDAYGILYTMTEETPFSGPVNRSSGDGWEDSNTGVPVIDTRASLGFTLGSGSPFTAVEMERHAHTQEALFCAGEPIVFLVAPAGPEEAPSLDMVRAVILRPGQVAVLHRGVWHSSAHGLNKAARYYYLALCYRNEPTEWRKIAGGPIEVEPVGE